MYAISRKAAARERPGAGFSYLCGKTTFMLKIVLTTLTVFTLTALQAQEIKMTDEAKKSYLRNGEKSPQARVESAAVIRDKKRENAPPAYVILNLMRGHGDETFKVAFDPGESVRMAKHMAEDLKRVERLEEITDQFKSEVDVLNYVAHLGWEVLSVTHMPREGKNDPTVTRVYIRKILEE